jgi:hypothetical protein
VHFLNPRTLSLNIEIIVAAILYRVRRRYDLIMYQNAPRPLSARTDLELAAISEMLGYQLTELSRQHAAIQAELVMRHRNAAGAADTLPQAGEFPNRALKYLTSATGPANQRKARNAYREQSRQYGLRVSGIIFMIFVIAMLVLYAVLAKHP